MRIIGITGAIGHGKTTLSEIFSRVEPSSRHLESFYLIAEVINQWYAKTGEPPAPDDLEAVNGWLKKLPKILQKTLHLEVEPELIIVTEQILKQEPVDYQKLFQHLTRLAAQPGLLEDEISDANKPAHRAILQWIGGYVTTHIDARAWYSELVRRAQADDNLRLVTIGGVRFPNDAAVLREAGGIVLEIKRPAAPQPDLTDPTERERQNIKADSQILNDDSLDALEKLVKQVWGDIQTGQLRPIYRASQFTG